MHTSASLCRKGVESDAAQETPLVFEDRGPTVAEPDEADAGPSAAEPDRSERQEAADSEPDSDADHAEAQDTRVCSILDMLQEGSEGEDAEAEEQQHQEQPADPVPARQQPVPKKPVWEDPGDAAEVVDIGGKSRLRKLRQHEAENSVTGACAQVI